MWSAYKIPTLTCFYCLKCKFESKNTNGLIQLNWLYAQKAIYGDSEDFESNIYENGLIVMKQKVQNNKHKCCGLRWGFGSKSPQKSNNTKSRNPCGGKKPKQYLIATVILSVIVFVLTGASLLITRGNF